MSTIDENEYQTLRDAAEYFDARANDIRRHLPDAGGWLDATTFRKQKELMRTFAARGATLRAIAKKLRRQD